MNRSTRLLKPAECPIHTSTPPPPPHPRYLAAAPSFPRAIHKPSHPVLSINRFYCFSPRRLSPTSGRLRRFHSQGTMEASRESSPESATSAPDGFVHVSDDDIAAAGPSAPAQDPVHERGIPEGADRGDLAFSADRASDRVSAEGSGGPEGGREEGGEEPKRVLPEELSKGVVVLECESSAEGGSCEVYLVGTAHVSQESCREVQAIINCLKPQVVFLELCASRVAILTPQNLKVPTMNEMVDMWRKKDANIFGILYSFFLAKVASKLEVFPGAEFRVAFEEARNYGAKVILGDRPVHITLRRTWGRMTLWHKAKFLYYIIFQSIFLPSPEDLNKLLKDLDDGDMLTLLIQEMSKAFPTLMETLLNERDMYMSSKLLKVASEHSSVVAVVGRGHLSGIKKNWKQPVEIQSLLEIPTSHSHTSTMRLLKSLGVAVTGVAIISGIYLSCKRRS